MEKKRMIARMAKKYQRYEFTIMDWSHVVALNNPGNAIKSPEFTTSNGSRWRLEVFPCGIEPEDAGNVSVVLSYLSTEQCSAFYTFLIINQLENEAMLPSGAIRQRCDSSSVFSSQSHVRKANKLIALKDLQSDGLAAGFIYNDTVKFAVEIAVLQDPTAVETMAPLEFEELSVTPTLGQQLGEVLSEQSMPSNYHDIVLACGATRFYCHRAILSARSSFFRRKFQGRYFGVKVFFHQGEYTMDDVEPDLLREFLKFLYTDQCSEVALNKHACSLLSLAMKHDARWLVRICEDFMIDTLVPEKAVSTTLFAESIDAVRLQFACLSLMASHLEEVVNSPGFEKIDAQTCRQLLFLSTLKSDPLAMKNSIQQMAAEAIQKKREISAEDAAAALGSPLKNPSAEVGDIASGGECVGSDFAARAAGQSEPAQNISGESAAKRMEGEGK